jgi:DNA-binding NarL/FixJ family response regulator
VIRVLIADDHPVVRTGYRRLLDQSGDIRVVGEAGDGATAWAAWQDLEPDVLVADVSMPGGGLELLRRVRQRRDDARVLVFSMHDAAPIVHQAFEAGASGYLTKSSPPESLVDAVRLLADGGRYLSPDLPEHWLQRDDTDERARLRSLSPREFEIFRLLAQGHSAQQCARELHLSAKTIANHQSTIKDKLGVATSAALAHLALRHGVIVSATGYR